MGQVVAALHVGSRVPVKIFRDGRTLTLQVVAAERKDGQEQETDSRLAERYGLKAQEVTPEIARVLGMDAKTGVIVTEVKAGGPADEAGLKPRDVILKIANSEISGWKEFVAALKQGDKGEVMLLLVRRGKANLFVTLKKAPEVKK